MEYVLITVPVLAAMIWFTLRSRRAERSAASPPASAREVLRPGDPRLDDILDRFDLSDRDTEFFGPWRECRVDGVRVAFQGNADELSIEVGDFDADEEQLSNIYLSSTRAGRPKPESRKQHLDPFLGPEGRAVADRYYLNATGASDYPQLKLAAVQTALRSLSDKVDELSFYESGGFGVRCIAVTRESVESDVEHALAIVRALRRVHARDSC